MIGNTLEAKLILEELSERIGSRLAATFALEIKSETGSTNDDAVEAGTRGAAEGTVILAERQTAGRGRRGEAWISPPGVNLLFSLLLRPEAPAERWTRLPHLAGLAVCRAIEGEFPELPPVKLKWPNDVFLADRKVAGILIESRFLPDSSPAVVVGIGLNVNLQTAQLPEEVRVLATTLRDQVGRLVDRNRLMAAFLAEWATLYPSELASDFTKPREDLRRRAWLLGRSLTVVQGDREVLGSAIDLGPEGELILESPTTGKRETIVSADRVRWG